MTARTFEDSARLLFGGRAPEAPAQQQQQQQQRPPVDLATDPETAIRALYGDPAPEALPPVVVDENAEALFGTKESWNERLRETYGDDLLAARELAAIGLIATSPDPVAERAAIGRDGISPARFRELVEAGSRVRGAR